jgi:hypothetical protein
MDLINIVFGFLSVFSLFFTLYKLVFIISQYKKYEVVMTRVLFFKNSNNSRNFTRENLVSEGFPEYIIDDVLDEYYS